MKKIILKNLGNFQNIPTNFLCSQMYGFPKYGHICYCTGLHCFSLYFMFFYKNSNFVLRWNLTPKPSDYKDLSFIKILIITHHLVIVCHNEAEVQVNRLPNTMYNKMHEASSFG